MGNALFDVGGKVVVVSGGSRGIGLMIARGFVEAGTKVYVSSRKKDACDEVAAELSKVGECVSAPADLSTEVLQQTFDKYVELGIVKPEPALDASQLVNTVGRQQ